MALSTDKSQSSQWAKAPDGPAVVTVHPDAAQGVQDGGLCRIESRVGSMVVRLRHDSMQRRDVALTPKPSMDHTKPVTFLRKPLTV
jgi:predicted molibdopterin-dependent oxidoreductase YjgC